MCHGNPYPKKKKIKFSYESEDEPAENEKDEFRLNVCIRVKDGITGAMTDRLVKHANLLADVNCLDPKRFDEIKKSVIDGTLAKFFFYIQRK